MFVSMNQRKLSQINAEIPVKQTKPAFTPALQQAQRGVSAGVPGEFEFQNTLEGQGSCYRKSLSTFDNTTVTKSPPVKRAFR
jgi:hypothetical protein